jgi:hypothetical protein
MTKFENGETILDFEKIIPVGDIEDWYWTRIKKWGTKWNSYDVLVDDAGITFYTAWSPPLPIIKRLAELYKDTVFLLEYNEPGMAFRGEATAKWEGDKLIFEESSWNMTSEDFKELGYEQEEDELTP